MAAPTLLSGINWTLNVPTTRAEYGNRRLSPQELDAIVLPGEDFSIMYPTSRDGYDHAIIPYITDGIPMTVHDILSTIYAYYQEPLSAQEISTILNGPDGYLYPELRQVRGRRVVRRLDVMNGNTFFEGLETMEPGVYALRLGS